MKKILKLCVFLWLCCGCVEAEGPEARRMLYLMHKGETAQALQQYRDYVDGLGHHDQELLQQLCIALMDEGFRSDDREKQLITLFGAGASLNERTLYILEEGANHSDPEIQLLCLNLLSRYQNQISETLLERAMSSKYLLLRLEAIYHLAQKKHSKAVHHAESLMAKVPDPVLPLFPQIFAACGTTDAMKILQRLLSHPNPQVRIAAIVSAVNQGRDDLLPKIRMLARQHDPVQQEACAYALGALHDESSIAQLESLANSSASNVQLAALQALYHLGKKEKRKEIEALAMKGDLFAITGLGKIPQSEETLATLCNHPNIQVSTNAIFALLEREDVRALKPLSTILLKNSLDLFYQQATSVGLSLHAYKVEGSATQKQATMPDALELSLLIREQALEKALNISENAFLSLANTLFEAKQNDLIPSLVRLLENLQTKEAVELLKKQQQKAGAPLIRNYCNLALFRLKEEGPYADQLQDWIEEKGEMELIRFRAILPREAYGVTSPYQLTPQDTSSLLVESFDAVASQQNDRGIVILIKAIEQGNSVNKYALAGLLMRAMQ